jgi:hypothetical protein
LVGKIKALTFALRLKKRGLANSLKFFESLETIAADSVGQPTESKVNQRNYYLEFDS